jgi:hypothetical protein
MVPDTLQTGQWSDRRPRITAAARPATPSGQLLAMAAASQVWNVKRPG